MKEQAGRQLADISEELNAAIAAANNRSSTLLRDLSLRWKIAADKAIHLYLSKQG